MKKSLVVVLAGNPNVGKSTLFNCITGMHQHTGNWPGKTVTKEEGDYETDHYHYHLIDLPGTYSLEAHSPEEEIARDYLYSKKSDITVIVCDGTCLERNLNLVLQIMKICKKVIVCVNLMDEVKRKGIKINLNKLSKILEVPVIGISAHQRDSVKKLMQVLEREAEKSDHNYDFRKKEIKQIEKIYREVVKTPENYNKKDRWLDQWFTGKWTGFPCMILFLTGILWLTIIGTNYPSKYLMSGMFWMLEKFRNCFLWLGTPRWMQGIIFDGIFQVLFWVVSVMLPPMAIFFPLFTLFEDSGYLPRIAYNLDYPLKCCGTCGKQALTMSMGFGCNAVGITGCRIIDSPRERLIAVLTNSFIPCNGRFPSIIAVITIFCSGMFKGEWIETVFFAGILMTIILFAILLTLFVSKMLSTTVLKGIPSFFTLELPPYRKPQIGKVMVRSIFDRTIFVLGRAVAIAAPAGAVIWLLANIKIGNVTILSFCVDKLEPFGRCMGLDGTILMAFILGLPANEIVIPIMAMIYMAKGNMVELSGFQEIHNLFFLNGWNLTTAVCFLIFSISHWPCAASLLTIRKETGSWKWMTISFLIPLIIGGLLCVFTNFFLRLL